LIILIIADNAIHAFIRLFIDVVSGSDYIASNAKVINELDRIGKEGIVDQFKVLLPAGTDENHEEY
jgi:hypothetical protein